MNTLNLDITFYSFHYRPQFPPEPAVSQNSSPFGYGLMYYLYLGIPERYMSTLVWSHNEFLASILACVTLGSIILMVMVSALIAGVRSGGVRICLCFLFVFFSFFSWNSDI